MDKINALEQQLAETVNSLKLSQTSMGAIRIKNEVIKNRNVRTQVHLKRVVEERDQLASNKQDMATQLIKMIILY